jgi:adenylate kinase family enzyme
MPTPKRIAIIGSSGSGKTTLAKRLGAVIGAPVIELDAINWQAGWRPLYQEDTAEFARRVGAAIAGETWVTDGNYRKALTPILARATDLVCLDFDRHVVVSRVLRRSFARAVDKQELWPGTGNREHFARWVDKEHPIRWAWDTFAERRAFYDRLEGDPAVAHLAFHRLRRPGEVPALIERFAVRS